MICVEIHESFVKKGVIIFQPVSFINHERAPVDSSQGCLEILKSYNQYGLIWKRKWLDMTMNSGETRLPRLKLRLSIKFLMDYVANAIWHQWKRQVEKVTLVLQTSYIMQCNWKVNLELLIGSQLALFSRHHIIISPTREHVSEHSQSQIHCNHSKLIFCTYLVF